MINTGFFIEQEKVHLITRAYIMLRRISCTSTLKLFQNLKWKCKSTKLRGATSFAKLMKKNRALGKDDSLMSLIRSSEVINDKNQKMWPWSHSRLGAKRACQIEAR